MEFTLGNECHIHVIEDDKDIAHLIQYNLSREGFNVNISHSGEEGLKFIKAKTPKLIILDWMLPGMDGLEVCKAIKCNSILSELSIIMLSAKGEESNIVAGLEEGADDYITKPFSPAVLIAKVKSTLRRINNLVLDEDKDVINAGELTLHSGKRQVSVSGNSVLLTNSEFEILKLLANKPGWVFSRARIVDSLHGVNYAVTDRTVDFQMVGLRKKLGFYGHLIETVRGIGYKLKDCL